MFEKIYEVVRKIPKGKVMTYGMVARKVGTTPRLVGWALHANKNPKIPCHRVVNKEGKLAENFAFGGWREQKRRLEDERIKFIDEKHVDFNCSGVTYHTQNKE